jgi:E3 ubiquitin-protein ligase makorin
MTPLMGRMFVVFQHMVKPGSYTWRHLRPPPRRPPPRRSGFVAMEDLFDMFDPIEELTSFETALDPMEELTSLEMALLLRDLILDTSDSSSDEEDLYSP